MVMEAEPNIALLMLTAVNDATSAALCMQRGAMDYLTKPIELTDLSRAIQRALRRRGLLVTARRNAMGIRVCVRAARSPVRPAAASGGAWNTAEPQRATRRGRGLRSASRYAMRCPRAPGRHRLPGYGAPLQRSGGRQQLAAAIRAAAARAGAPLARWDRCCGGGRDVSRSRPRGGGKCARPAPAHGARAVRISRYSRMIAFAGYAPAPRVRD